MAQMKVMVYQDPIAREKPEGMADVLRLKRKGFFRGEKDVTGGRLCDAIVHFDGDDLDAQYMRAISIPELA